MLSNCQKIISYKNGNTLEKLSTNARQIRYKATRRALHRLEIAL